MLKDKENLDDKVLSWDEFEERLDKIFESIQKLIQDTNGTQND